MSKQKIWESEHIISWDDTSPAGTLNLTGLNILLQRAAVDHAEHLGFGYQVMSRQNLSWVLIRANIEIYRMPRWREAVRLVTWPREMARLSAFREYVMYGQDGQEVLCNASSEWLLIDLDTRRPQKMEAHKQYEAFATRKEALTRKMPRVTKSCNYCDLFTLKPRHSTLDMNGHANARKYIDWLDDALYEIHGQKELSFMHMSYFHECKYGEELIIQYCKDDLTVVRGWKASSGQIAFLAKVEFA
ncbi:MAG: thioesterase [bacterium]|jgi:medium-chain acyl-[acyl-carrier-protein] hydrolase